MDVSEFISEVIELSDSELGNSKKLPDSEKLPNSEKLPRLGLCAIVANESKIIRRMLNSVKDIIDTWVIVDTGSTDDTMEIIQEELKDIPGFLLQQKWQDFGTNRSAALAAAEGKMEWILMMDADDFLTGVTSKPTFLDAVSTEIAGYSMPLQNGITFYSRVCLYRASSKWIYKNRVHEWPFCTSNPSFSAPNFPLAEWLVQARSEGFRSTDPSRWLKDAKLCVADLEDDLGNERACFYAARSFSCAGERELAIAYFQKRLKYSTGFYSERYWCWIGLLENYEDPLKKFECFEHAIREFPHRLEVVQKMLYFLRTEGWERSSEVNQLLNQTIAHAQIMIFKVTRCPVNDLFVENDVYEWKLADELALALSHQKNYIEAGIYFDLAFQRCLCEVNKSRIENGRNWCLSKIIETKRGWA